jgi:hypothetical protein
MPMKRISILFVAAAICSAPAFAEDVIIKEKQVVREREPSSKVIIKELRNS